MALALVAESAPLDLTEYAALEHRIDGDEGDALLARWEFGRLILAEREANGGNFLPYGRLEALCEITGKSRSELKQRAQFAQRFETREKVGNALSTFGSWYGIVKDGLPVTRLPVTRNAAADEPTPIETATAQLWGDIEESLVDIEAALKSLARRQIPAPAAHAALLNLAVAVRQAKRAGNG